MDGLSCGSISWTAQRKLQPCGKTQSPIFSPKRPSHKLPRLLVLVKQKRGRAFWRRRSELPTVNSWCVQPLPASEAAPVWQAALAADAVHSLCCQMYRAIPRICDARSRYRSAALRQKSLHSKASTSLMPPLLKRLGHRSPGPIAAPPSYS